MSNRTIDFYDGNTGQLIATQPFDEVPPANREAYYRQGKLVPFFSEGDQVVPIARVVKTATDSEGQPTSQNQAVYVEIDEFDDDGQRIRHTRLERAGG
jgi:hypothetical protein